MLKKQYLISGVILLLAVALILVYFLFLREEAPVTETDPFFVLTDEAKAQVDTLRDDVRIVLLRSETEIAADALRTRMRSFLELYPQANDAVTAARPIGRTRPTRMRLCSPARRKRFTSATTTCIKSWKTAPPMPSTASGSSPPRC